MNGALTLSRTLLLFLSLSLIVCASPLAARQSASQDFKGATYSANVTNHDFRTVTTLNEFNRMVYRERWEGVRAGDVLAELRKFNGINGSPALRMIWRDVLLSDFSALRVKDGAEQVALMAERLYLLNRLGFFEEAVHLYQQASQKKPIPGAVAREGIDAMALSGSADGACLEVFMAAKQLPGKNWQQDAAICAAYFGDTKQANELYETVVADTDSGFRTVFKMLSGNKSKAIQANIPPLWRTLLLAKGATITPAALRTADPTTLSAIATNKYVPLGTRLAAASRAADIGTIGPDKLRKLYEMKHSTGDGVSIESTAQSDLYAAARFTFEGNARASIVQKALQGIHPETNIKGHVFTWIVDKLTLQVERLGWFAPYGYSLMTVTNRTDSAEMYYEAGHLDQSPFSIMHALQAGKPWSIQDQQNWAVSMKKAGKAKLINKAYFIARAFDQENKLALNQQSLIRMDDSSGASVLAESIRRGGRGLTLVEALNRLAQPRQMSDLPEAEIAGIIKSLTKQGLFGERKKIALEILVQTVL